MKSARSKNLLIQADVANSILGTAATPSRQMYSPYGVSKPGTFEDMLGFTGLIYDPVSESYLLGNGHRAYSPSLMCFYQPDSFSPFHDGGINCYAYCQNDPINFTDPTGRFRMPRPPVAKTRTDSVSQDRFRASQGFYGQRPRRVQQRAERRRQQGQRPQDRPQRVPQDNREAPQPHQGQEMNLAQLVQVMDHAVLQARNIGRQAINTQQIHPFEGILMVMALAMTASSTGETAFTWMTTGAIRNPMDTTRAVANYSPGYSPRPPPVG
ncbi:RHS repeat-associated core domain-containing protein [Pseudomonas asiatica]|uniref:RHS repeat-associated core domain-containing protein n=1 Tax=Pseudomonas asiatica TaxID=2219225 RepID=UPI00383B1D51